MRLKNYILTYFAIISVIFGLYYFSYLKHPAIQDAKLKEALATADIYGNKITDYQDKKFIIINFWASWCPPCVEETPSLIRFAEKYEKDFYLIALSQDDSKKEIFSFTKTFPTLKSEFIHIIHDNSQAIARSYKVDKLPETFIYSVKKNKYMQFSGATNWDSPEVIDLINRYFQ